MAFLIDKDELNSSIIRSVRDECIFSLKQNFMEVKLKKEAKVFSLYDRQDGNYIVPFNFAVRHGFKFKENKYWHFIQPMLPSKKFKNLLKQNTKDSSFRKFKGEFRDYQEEIIDQLLDDLDEHSSTTLGLPPGWGKTMAGIFLAWRLGYRVLIICSIKKVFDSWLETFKLFVPNFKVWLACSKTKCPKDVDIILCMDGQFEHIPNKILRSVGTLIADEVHLLCTETRISMFLSVFPRYVIFQSATIIKNNDSHLMAFLIAGTHGVFKICTDPYDVILVHTPIKGDEVIICGMKNSSKMRQSIMRNSYHQDIVLSFILNNYKYHKFISLRMVKEAIESFVSRVTDTGISCDSLYGSKSKVKNSIVTVGTQQKMGTGYDEKMACVGFDGLESNVIIFENTTPDASIYEQGRGRGMRALRGKVPRKCIVVMFVSDNKNAKNHVEQLRWWFKETNATVKEIELKKWDMTLSKGKKINSRTYSKGKFYCLVNSFDYKIYKKYGILPRPESEDKRVYKTKEELSEHISDERYVFVLHKVNVYKVSNGMVEVSESEGSDSEDSQQVNQQVYEEKYHYICSCPIIKKFVKKIIDMEEDLPSDNDETSDEEVIQNNHQNKLMERDFLLESDDEEDD